MAFDKSVFAKLAAPTVPMTLTQGDASVDLLLCYDMNAAKAVKSALGKSLFSENDLRAMDPSDWPTVVWAGLQCHQKGITVEDVGSIMNPGNYQYIVGKCMEALTISLPKGTVDPKAEPTAKPASAQ